MEIEREREREREREVKISYESLTGSLLGAVILGCHFFLFT